MQMYAHKSTIYGRMKTVLTFLTILHIILFSGCNSNSRKDNGAMVEKVTPECTITIEEEKEKKVRKPHTGNVKEFFLDYAQSHPSTLVRLKTRLGDIDIKLYEETPIHRGNFLYNINQELYDQTIFYRVVPNFMIQGGNSDHDKTLEKREEEAAYYIPNECQPHLIHKRGALAMAMSYDDNPEKKSAQYSYYIVIGTRLSEDGLYAVEDEYGIKISQENRKTYSNIGGTPHLDGVHTVFGEVVKGMEVVIAISNEKRDSGDWPINDVLIECEVLN